MFAAWGTWASFPTWYELRRGTGVGGVRKRPPGERNSTLPALGCHAGAGSPHSFVCLIFSGKLGEAAHSCISLEVFLAQLCEVFGKV